ncbi:MAG: SDR family oxidoreductase [Planctomycetes bacterium]|nr:SDR family oxidoreductase [Planctomycetota bacterium]
MVTHDHKPKPFAGRTALVTGGAKRIGRAIVMALAEAGANVVIHYNYSQEEAEAVAEHARALGVSAWTAPADLRDGEQACLLISSVVGLSGPLDILVNNASIFPESGLLDFTPVDLSENIQVNAHAPLELSRAFYAQGMGGSIVNMLDARVHDYDSKHVAYHISKRMLHDLTKMMAFEFGPSVKVNGVAPGLILPPEGEDESYLEKLKSTNPLCKYGCLSDITDTVLFLVGSSFITGEVIHVDGGRHLKGNVYG